MGQADSCRWLPGLPGVDGVPDGLLYILVHSLAEVLLGIPIFMPATPPSARSDNCDAPPLPMWNPPIVAGDDLHEQSRILYRMGERADLLRELA